MICISFSVIAFTPFYSAHFTQPWRTSFKKRARNLHDGLKRVVGESDVGIKPFGRILDRGKIDLAVRNSNRIGFNEVAAPKNIWNRDNPQLVGKGQKLERDAPSTIASLYSGFTRILSMRRTSFIVVAFLWHR